MPSKRNRDDYEEQDERTVLVKLDEVNIPQRTWDRILRKDHGQIEEMRAEIESGRTMMRVVLRPRCGGGYDM
jgi:hypothetical protein